MVELLADVDLFHVFRRLLVITCGIYAFCTIVRSLNRWLPAPGSDRPYESWMRRYLVTQLFRVRLRAFVLDLFQITMLGIIFCYVIILHR